MEGGGVGKQQTITSYTTAAQFASFSSSWSGFDLAQEPGRDKNTVNQMRPQQRSHRHDGKRPHVDSCVMKKKRLSIFLYFFCALAVSAREISQDGVHVPPYAQVFHRLLQTENVSKLRVPSPLSPTLSLQSSARVSAAHVFPPRALCVSLLTFLSISEHLSRVGDPVASDQRRTVCG